MNTDNFTTLINSLKAEDIEFQMGWPLMPSKDYRIEHPFKDYADIKVAECNSAGCLAGTVAMLTAPEGANMADTITTATADHLSEFLDIGYYLASALYVGEGVWAKYHEELGLGGQKDEEDGPITHVSLEEITRNQAITLLTNLRDGVWSFV